MIIQYRIQRPYDDLFKVRDPGATLRDASEAVMREVVGDRTVDEVLTIGRQEIEAKAQVKLQQVIDKYEMGYPSIRYSSRTSTRRSRCRLRLTK